MEDNELDNLESLNQDIDDGADNESKDTSDKDDKRYLNQKVRAEKAEQAKKLAEEKAKLLEEELKKAKTDNTPQLSDELKLIARGLSDEEIDQAKVIAKGKEISLQEAIKDPLFTIFQADLKEKQKKEDAKLGASKGSGESIDESLIKPDMTREEHMEAFKKVMGK